MDQTPTGDNPPLYPCQYCLQLAPLTGASPATATKYAVAPDGTTRGLCDQHYPDFCAAVPVVFHADVVVNVDRTMSLANGALGA